MGAFDEDEITDFGETARGLMEQSHPRTHALLSPFVDQLADINHIEPSDESRRALLDASAAVPYLLASTTSMKGCLSTELSQWEKGAGAL